MKTLLLIISGLLFWNTLSAQDITDAAYNTETGELTINGSSFNSGGSENVFPTKITIVGYNSTSYTLTNATPVGDAGPSSVILNIAGIDRAYMNAILDQNGTTASSSDAYELIVDTLWNQGGSDYQDGIAITVSNFAAPQITTAEYYYNSGKFVFTCTNLASDLTSNNDINVSHFSIKGFNNNTYTLGTSTSDLEVTNSTSFTIYLEGDDKSGVDDVLDLEGTASSDGKTYNINATENWNDASTATDLDNTTPVTVFNVPLLSDATASETDICPGENITLNANPSGATGAYSYAWSSIPSGTYPNNESISVSPTETTAYYVTVTDGTKTHTSNVVVSVNPLPELSTNRTPDPICSGTEFNYTPSSNQNVISFAWNRDDITGINEGASGSTGSISETLTNSTNSPVAVKYYYTLTSNAGCVNTDSISFDVNPNGQVNDNTDQTVCNGNSTSIISFSTNNSGGTTTYEWSNNNNSIGLASSGVSDIESFTAINNGTEPVTATIEVTPTFENGGVGCPAPAPKSFNINLNPSAQVDDITDKIVCHQETVPEIAFSTSNTGGTTTYSWTSSTDVGFGTGDNGNIAEFNANNTNNSPRTATVTVYPEYTSNGVTCNSTTNTFNVTVNPNGQVNALTDQTLCDGEATSYINFSTNNTGGSTSYEWTNNTPAIGLSSSGTDDINSFVIDIGNSTMESAKIKVTPKFTYNSKECAGEPDSLYINVNPSPDVSFIMPQSTYSNSAPADTINGATPYGGIFSGPGIIASDSTFHPSSAGDGIHTISYTYTNANGCSNTATNTVNVVPPGGSILNLESYYCDYADGDTIIGRPDVGGITTCIECGFQSETWLAPLNDTTAIIYPSVAPEGSLAIYFTYEQGGALFDVIRTTEIHKVNGIASFNGLKDSYCIDADTTQLSGYPTGGNFYGNGITNVNIFDPGIAGTGNDTVMYVYTLASTTCKDTATQITTVNDLPNPHFDAAPQYCENGSPVTLSGTPAGGAFTGPNLSGTNPVTFTPTSSIVGSNTINYSYTDVNGCSNIYSHTFDVTSVANIGIESIEPDYCINGDTVELRGEVAGSFTGNGDFTGNGISDDVADDGLANFIPADAGIGGPYNITFTYTDLNGCTSNHTETLLIRALPTVSINNLENLYCIGSPAEVITGVPQSSSGSFAYAGDPNDLNNYGDGTANFIPNHINDTGYITYTYTDDYGCTNSHSQNVTVAPLPTVYFESDSVFCPNGSPVELIGEPAGGMFSGPNITGTDTATFTPSTNLIGNNIITYTYTDANSCTNAFARDIQINALPLLSIESIAPSYCVNDDSVLVRGEVNGSVSGEGYFFGNGIYDADSLDGAAYFYPDSAGIGGPYQITYTYTDTNNCVAYLDPPANVQVRSLPTVSLSGLSDIYCEGSPASLITGIPNDNPGEFAYQGPALNLIDNGNGTADIRPDSATQAGIVSYTYTDNFGCQNTAFDTIKVSALPEVGFTTSSYCVTDTIFFYDTTLSEEEILSWSWVFDDIASGSNTSTEQNPNHYYETGGNKEIMLEVTTIDGCNNSLTKSIELNSGPSIDFTWDNECAGTSSTQFINLSDDTTQVLWEFGDGSTSTEVNPNHNYSEINTYDVTLHVNSAFGCQDSLIKTLNIRPYVSSYPYLQDFESQQGGWNIDVNMQTSSWEFGAPEGVIINSAFSGTNSWCTNLKGSYYNNELSSITSPCFDFSNMDKPMIKMNIWSATQENMDGAVMQAKIVGETDWFNIGGLNEVINWYNGVGLPGNPGGGYNVGSYGWTGIDTAWKEVRHKLDELAGKENVRFRVSFGSDNSGNTDGFAFDDIWLGERSRQVIVESFTNTGSAGSASVNPEFNTLMTQKATDAIDIQYHTSFPGFDELNDQNPSDPSARSTYYGITDVPWAVVNGNIMHTSTTQVINNHQTLDEQALLDPLFKIELETIKTENQIEVNADIKSMQELTNYELTAQVLIIENEITEVTGENGETEFLSVLRKMLPNAGGTNLPQNWDAGQTEQISFSWQLENVYDPEKINAVVFIQDETTQEIYQGATDDSASSQNGIAHKLVSMKEEEGFIVYPNPASAEIMILLKNRLQSTGTLNIYNTTGKLIGQKSVDPGVYKFPMNVNHMKPGLYLIRLIENQRIIDTRRFIKLE
ncbi:PKD domain-containing protein [Salinivirga cyanobacteriivorans]